MSEPVPSFNPRPTKAKLKLPPGSCDAHFHVFGPKAEYPFAKDAPYVPADAPKEELFAMHEFLGIDRGVVVQSAAHGFDNRAAADLIAAKKGRYVGVALLPLTATVDDMKKLQAQGFCGVRFNYFGHLGTPPPIADVIKFAAKLVSVNWHLQVHLEASHIEQIAPQLKNSPVPVMIDHMGRIDAEQGLDQMPFRVLLSLLEDKKIWVKVSGAERASREGEPYADAVPYGRKLVDTVGDRVVWGTDWPHPNLKAIPDDGVLVDLVGQMADSEAKRKALLVDNPAKFYGLK
ncbi:MAG TPA: amidohydrolase family protein [Burkholderiales bacterium]